MQSGIRYATTKLSMKIAIPIWNGRVSPVMDTAACLLVTARETGKEDLKYTVPLPRAGIHHRVKVIADLRIDALICGAISRPFEELLAQKGIRVHPWISGVIEEVIMAFWDGRLMEREFNLPGYRCRNRNARGSGMRRRRKRFN